MALRYEASQLQDAAERMNTSAWIAELTALVAGLVLLYICDQFLPMQMAPESDQQILQLIGGLVAFAVCLLAGRAVGSILRGQAQIVLGQAIALGQVKAPAAPAKEPAAAE